MEHNAPTDPKPPVEPVSEGAPPWLKIGIVFGALCAGVGLLLWGDAGDAFVYSKLVNEVVDSPQEFAGRTLRVEGDLRRGSVEFREEPCEWRFVIERNGAELPISFPECVVPDTFRDDYGIIVTVQGQLQDDGSFHATELIPRCPSKYEEKLQAGENMPIDLEHRTPS